MQSGKEKCSPSWQAKKQGSAGGPAPTAVVGRQCLVLVIIATQAVDVKLQQQLRQQLHNNNADHRKHLHSSSNARQHKTSGVRSF